MKHLIWLAATLCLGACAVSDDPSKGESISGVYGVSSGTYDRRIEGREANLADLRTIHNETAATQVRLRITKSKEQRQLEALRQQSQTLDVEIQQLEQHVQQANIKNVQAKRQQQRLRAQVGQLQKDVVILQTRLQQKQVDQTQIKAYQAEESRLRQKLNVLKQDLYLLD